MKNNIFTIRLYCFLLMLLILITGCNSKQPENQNYTIIPEGTAVDIERITSLSNPDNVTGGLVYVPVYSSVFHRTGDEQHLVTVTLSIHNVNLTENIEITDVIYCNTEGRWISKFVENPIILDPLATKQFVIPELDKTGGTGANFLVKWESSQKTIHPVIESLMISTSSQQGLSFVCRGTLIQELKKADK